MRSMPGCGRSGKDQPFGGVQIVMVGDFLQLPPVVESGHRPLLHGLGYHTPYAFSAQALEHVPVTTVSLEHVYRQDEGEFIDILSQIRMGEGHRRSRRHPQRAVRRATSSYRSAAPSHADQSRRRLL